METEILTVRTPEARFAGLPGWPWAPHYVDVSADGFGPVRMHYVDTGPDRQPPVLLVHGHPTWSYMWRGAIDELHRNGHRVVAIDLVGYGRSDKPVEPSDYTFQRHIGWVSGLVDALDLGDVTLVVHDWGGPIGLGVLARQPHRFRAVVATNTILHTCAPSLDGQLAWSHHATGDGRMVLQQDLLDYVLLYPRFPDLAPSLFVGAVSGPLSDPVAAAYDAPFPDRSFKSGLRQMPLLIPLTPNDPGAAINRRTTAVLSEWTRPFLTAYSDQDPATRGWDRVFQQLVPGATGLPHATIAGAGHFVPESSGTELAGLVMALPGRLS